jgi:hypothetical protein
VLTNFPIDDKLVEEGGCYRRVERGEFFRSSESFDFDREYKYKAAQSKRS